MMSRLVLLSALLLLPLAFACQTEPKEGLDTALRKLDQVRGKVQLGETQGVTFGPYPHADWLVLVPENASPGAFEVEPAFRREAGDEVVRALSGRNAPMMALVRKGKIVEEAPLMEPYAVPKLLARRAEVVGGVRFVRLVNNYRPYQIRQID